MLTNFGRLEPDATPFSNPHRRCPLARTISRVGLKSNEGVNDGCIDDDGRAVGETEGWVDDDGRDVSAGKTKGVTTDFPSMGHTG